MNNSKPGISILDPRDEKENGTFSVSKMGKRERKPKWLRHHISFPEQSSYPLI
jgi:hypothetical protein